MSAALPAASLPTRTPTLSGRARTLKWLRQGHAWLGLWGACLGLLFGISGFVLNHRAILKLPITHKMAEQELVVAAPAGVLADDAALETWLRREFGLGDAKARWRNSPAQAVEWSDGSLMQPAKRQLTLATPRAALEVVHWAGSPTLTVKRMDANGWATLNRLHMGQGLGAAWVLLVDSIAGGLVLLSLSGVLLWTRLQARRLLAAGVGVTAFAGLITAFAFGLI